MAETAALRGDRAAQLEAEAGIASRASGSVAARAPAWVRPPGRGHKGAGTRAGSQAQGRLRGRPEPDPHADAKAARPAHEEVDAVRELPDQDAAGQPRRPRRALRAGAEVTPETLKKKGLAKRSDPVKILVAGEISRSYGHAHGFSAAAKERIEAAGGPANSGA